MRIGICTLLVALLAACSGARRDAEPAALGAGCVAPPIDADATAAGPGQRTSYRIVADESLLVIIARRAGTLASLGHDHVIAARQLDGRLGIGSPRELSSFSISVPVAGFTVDEPDLRAGRYSGIDAPVDESVRTGTRERMLGPAVLDAARYPAIRLASLGISGGPRDYAVDACVVLKGQGHRVTLPARVVPDGADGLRVSGRLTLRQSELGLEPFSVMLGALGVADELEVEYDLVARPAAATPPTAEPQD